MKNLTHHQYHHHRYNSGSSSGNKKNNTDAIATVTETITKRRSKRKKQSFSPLQQITSNHPKNTKPPSTTSTYNTSSSTTNDDMKLLTRKQLLRLTPKQRSNLHRHRLQQQKDSMSYLQQARTNVRSNLNYLSDTAGNNFKKNIKTMQRLFRGEGEIWKETEIAEGSSKQHQQRLSKNQKQLTQPEEEVGLDWERVPSEIKQNVQTNLATLQNWLHKTTDGIVPSPSLVKTDGDGGGSIATRVQHFHQAKQSHSLVMDNKWLAWNIALALLPGALIGLYLYSMQDEMKEYYIKLEEQERARILGPSAAASASDGKNGDVERQNGNRNEKKGMGISSALVSEGGGVLEKVKLVVNDLFLGGVEDRVGKAARDDGEVEGDSTEKQQQQDDDEDQSTTSASTSAQHQDDNSIPSTTAKQPPSESEVTRDPAMKVLLQRIEQLEKQLGVDKKDSDVQEQQQSHEHTDKHIKEKFSRQSPMQIRRDASLASLWSKEEQMKRSRTEAEVVSTKNDDESDTSDESSSITLWKFVQGMKSLVDNDVNSVREMIRQKAGILEDLLVTTSKEEETVNESNDETDNESDAVAEIAAEEVTVDNAPQKVDVPIEERTSSTAAVENNSDKIEDEQAKDAHQVKGFRAWISRLSFRKQNRGQADTKE